MEQEKKRTVKQNRALHKYFGLLADQLNLYGLDMRTVLKPEIEIPWSANAIKEYMWKPIQKIQLNKEHTAELNTKEIDAVFDTINRFIGEKFGVHIPFPSIEEELSQESYPQVNT